VVGIALSAFFAVGYLGIEQLSEPSKGQPERIASADVESHITALHDLSTGAPYRSIEFSGSKASIRYGDPITISVSGTSDSETLSTHTTQPEPLIYDVGQSQVVSVGGAMILQDRNGGAVLKKSPLFSIAPQQSTFRLIHSVQNDGSDQISIGENQPAYVSNHRWNTITNRFEPTDSNGDLEIATITITVQSPRYEAWERFFDEHSQTSVVSTSPGSNQVTAEFQTRRLLIQQTTVHMKLTQ
jgi:hypothetical protein